MRDPSLTNSYGYYGYYLVQVPDSDANSFAVPEILGREYELAVSIVNQAVVTPVEIKYTPVINNVQTTNAVGTGTSYLVGNQPPPMVDLSIAAPFTNADLDKATQLANIVGAPLPPSLAVRQFGLDNMENFPVVVDDTGINPVINSQGDRLADVTHETQPEKKDSGIAWLTIIGLIISALK